MKNVAALLSGVYVNLTTFVSSPEYPTVLLGLDQRGTENMMILTKDTADELHYLAFAAPYNEVDRTPYGNRDFSLAFLRAAEITKITVPKSSAAVQYETFRKRDIDKSTLQSVRKSLDALTW